MSKKHEYLRVLSKEASAERRAAVSLCNSGITTRIVSMIDKNVDGLHVDVHGRMGEVALYAAGQQGRRAIALVHNPFSGKNGVNMAESLGIPVQAHLVPEPAEQEDGSVKMQKSISGNALSELDLDAPGTLTVLHETIENRQVLEYILSQGHRIHSLSWTFQGYGDSHVLECNPYQPLAPQIENLHKRITESVRLFATLRIPEHGQLVVAETLKAKRHQTIEHIQRKMHAALEHWKSAWKPERGILIRSNPAHMKQFTQMSMGSHNAIGIVSFRRTDHLPLDAFDKSNEILGID